MMNTSFPSVSLCRASGSGPERNSWQTGWPAPLSLRQCTGNEWQVSDGSLPRIASAANRRGEIGANRTTNYNMLSLSSEFLKRPRVQWFQRFG
jgi:hypothetical protein